MKCPALSQPMEGDASAGIAESAWRLAKPRRVQVAIEDSSTKPRDWSIAISRPVRDHLSWRLHAPSPTRIKDNAGWATSASPPRSVIFSPIPRTRTYVMRTMPTMSPRKPPVVVNYDGEFAASTTRPTPPLSMSSGPTPPTMSCIILRIRTSLISGDNARRKVGILRKDSGGQLCRVSQRRVVDALDVGHRSGRGAGQDEATARSKTAIIADGKSG